jgi:hypothetical protein
MHIDNNELPDAHVIDPATNATIQNFLDDFVQDPMIRMEIEVFLSHAARVNPFISEKDLAELGRFSEVYRDAKHHDARELIRHGANQAVLGILQVWHEIREAL